MRLWVDADACPGLVRDVIVRAAERCAIEAIFVANRMTRLPPSAYVRAVQVEQGFDVADTHIAESCAPGDLVITADIPLAARVVEAGATALNPRGALYTHANIRELLSERDFMESLRSAGLASGGPAALSKSDVQAFAGQLDRFLARR